HIVDSERFTDGASAIAARRGALRRKWGLPEDDAVFLFTGKFITKKRPMDFVKAIARVRRMGAPVSGLMVGDGALRAPCTAAAAREAGAPIRFTGFLNQREIVEAYIAADALVLPSDGGETWGLVVNEAMACGRPCFVSDAVGCGPDLVDEGFNGATFPCGDVEKLAAVLERHAGRRILTAMGE